MCYWLIYVEEKDGIKKLDILARPFESFERLYEWLNKNDTIKAISITTSIYSKDIG